MRRVLNNCCPCGQQLCPSPVLPTPVLCCPPRADLFLVLETDFFTLPICVGRGVAKHRIRALKLGDPGPALESVKFAGERGGPLPAPIDRGSTGLGLFGGLETNLGCIPWGEKRKSRFCTGVRGSSHVARRVRLPDAARHIGAGTQSTPACRNYVVTRSRTAHIVVHSTTDYNYTSFLRREDERIFPPRGLLSTKLASS